MRLLVLGGTRSGKSAHAEAVVSSLGGSVVYVATARVPSGDAEMTERIAVHRSRRPADWTTVESHDLPTSLAEHPRATVLVDDLGGWVTSLLDARLGWTESAGVLDTEVDALIDALRGHDGHVVLVSPEVGLGVVPDVRSARLFSDILGSVNRAVAQVCDRVELVVAGCLTVLETPTVTPAVALAPAEAPMPTPAPAPVPAVTAAAPVPTAAERDLTVDGDPLSFAPVPVPSHEVADQARVRQLELTKPAGSLGRLEELGIWFASCRGECPPPAIERARVVVFAGDHGVAEHGVSAYPQEVTVQMVANILAGGAAVSVLAREAGATVRVVDIAVAADCPGGVDAYKVRRSSGSIDREDALSEAELRAAVAAGRAVADEEIDSGADLLIAGDLGIGNTTPATALTAIVTGTEPVAVVGRGTGIDDQGWMRKTEAIRDAMFRCRDDLRSPSALLRRAGGADLAAMAGFLAQAAVRRTPVLLDGAVVTAAALLAEQLAPGARGWWRAGHRSAEQCHTVALTHLGLQPILEHGMRLGEGSGAVAALPQLRSAVAILSEMATFADAGVSGKD